MEHLQVKAAATTTEQGEFTAIAAAYTLDRGGDQIVPGAFEKTIAAWKATGRQIPIHWDHEGSAESIIGAADPKAMRETKEGLYIEGRLDIAENDVAREAWRSMKNNALALSFGYLPTKTKKDGDVVKLLELDLFEVSIVPAPMNNDTRVLSLKNALAVEGAKDEAGVTVHLTDIESVQAFVTKRFPDYKLVETSSVEDGRDEEPEKAKSAPQDPLKTRTLEVALEVSNGGMRVPKHIDEPEPEPDPEPLNEAELRRRSSELALEIARGY